MVFVLYRQGLSSGGYVSTGNQLQESVYTNRGQYEEPPSSSRPRPVGGSTGAVIWMFWSFTWHFSHLICDYREFLFWPFIHWISWPPGAQLHHLTQVGLSSQIGVYPGVGRSMSGPTGSSWNQQHSDQDLSRPGASRESVSLLWGVGTKPSSSVLCQCSSERYGEDQDWVRTVNWHVLTRPMLNKYIPISPDKTRLD